MQACGSPTKQVPSAQVRKRGDSQVHGAERSRERGRTEPQGGQPTSEEGLLSSAVVTSRLRTMRTKWAIGQASHW